MPGSAPPEHVIGFLYVLEGATNGGRFIAPRLREVYQLEDRGMRAIDPHGDAQTERWQHFRTQLVALPLDEVQTAAMIAGAERMFRFVIELQNQMDRPPSDTA